MALLSSGTMSIGGSTTGRSINLELGRSAGATSSLGETALRTLAGVSSGAISMDDFYGASDSLDTQTVTIGFRQQTGYIPAYYGYQDYLSVGSVSDGTCNFKSGAAYKVLAHTSFSQVWFQLAGSHANSGWTTMKVGSTTFNRTSAGFSSTSTATSWTWGGITTNPFGTSGTVSVVFN